MAQRALILNASFEPLSIVKARRAVVLVIRGRADIVEPGDDVWRSERMIFDVPSVVRLRSYVKVPYGRRVPLTRSAVFARDGQRCQYCRGPAESLDHVVPRSRGGTHTWDNVVACCRRCNIRKGNKMLQECGFSLTKRPAAPSYHGWLYTTIGSAPDPRWQPYLLADSA